MDQTPYIVAVDDMPYNLEILEMGLDGMGVEIVSFLSGKEAIASMKERRPDLLLLDIMMPEMDGFEVIRALKANSLTKDIPVIFISSIDNVDEKVSAFQLGCVDYITKPFNILEVIARVNTHLKLNRLLIEMNELLRESFHELYTPLSLIKSSLALHEMEHGKTEYTQNIKSASLTLHSVYEDLYYAIKKEVRDYPKEWIEIENFVKKRIESFGPKLEEKQLTFEMASSVDTPMMHINITELERLFDNLVSNAIKYALEKSVIHVTIDMIEDERIQIVISNASKKIKDVKKLFEELYREDHSVMGLGIGLKIVKKICQKNHIEIDVAHEDSVTSFILRYKEK